MKHATSEVLASIDGLLQQLRTRARLVERTPGCFYFRSSAFMHFHGDSSGVYADVKCGSPGFSRMPCTSVEEQQAVLRCVDRTLQKLAAASDGRV